MIELLNAAGNYMPLPMHDPMVIAHVSNPKALVSRLIEQINTERLYDFAFKTAKDWTMLDIGANIGLVSLYASPACRRIVSLEPSPQFNVLKSLCRDFPNIEPIQMALGPRIGTTMFMLNDENPTASSSVQTYGTPITVECTNLASLIRTHRLGRVDFCKVDIEGSETDCLTPHEVGSLTGVIQSYFVEVHNCPNSSWESKLGKLAETFAHAGYRRMRIRGDSIYAAFT